MRKTIGILLCSLLAVAALPSTTAQPLPGQCVKTGTTVECDVQLHEVGPGGPYHVLPERVDAAVGDTLVFHVQNQGNSNHNLVICGDGKPPSDKCADKWAFTQDMNPNSSRTITVQSVPQAGTFYYYCLLPGHGAIGMQGELKVAGAAKKSGSDAAFGAVLALAAVALILRRT